MSATMVGPRAEMFVLLKFIADDDGIQILILMVSRLLSMAILLPWLWRYVSLPWLGRYIVRLRYDCVVGHTHHCHDAWDGCSGGTYGAINAGGWWVIQHSDGRGRRGDG